MARTLDDENHFHIQHNTFRTGGKKIDEGKNALSKRGLLEAGMLLITATFLLVILLAEVEQQLLLLGALLLSPGQVPDHQTFYHNASVFEPPAGRGSAFSSLPGTLWLIPAASNRHMKIIFLFSSSCSLFCVLECVNSSKSSCPSTYRSIDMALKFAGSSSANTSLAQKLRVGFFSLLQKAGCCNLFPAF